MKRNTIVMEKDSDSFYRPYGRIVRTIDQDTVEVIFTTKDLRIHKKDALQIVYDYIGFWSISGNGCDVERFYRMPTIRRLKQKAAIYDKNVWKWHRKKQPISVMQ